MRDRLRTEIQRPHHALWRCCKRAGRGELRRLKSSALVLSDASGGGERGGGQARRRSGAPQAEAAGARSNEPGAGRGATRARGEDGAAERGALRARRIGVEERTPAHDVARAPGGREQLRALPLGEVRVRTAGGVGPRRLAVRDRSPNTLGKPAEFCIVELRRAKRILSRKIPGAPIESREVRPIC